MDKVLLFFSGLCLANGIPHFVHGISGKKFHTPFLYRFFKGIPSPLFNVVWGLLFFGLSFFFLSFLKEFYFGINWNSLVFAGGFVFASVGLSLFFNRPYN